MPTQNSDIRYEIRNYTIRSLYDKYKDLSLQLNNEFSRDFLWKEKAKIELVETVLRNIPLPLIYLYQDEIGNYQIIDGKQRLQTVFDFLDNKFGFHQGAFFSNIEQRSQYLFENYTFICYILRPPISYELIKDIFILFNTKGIKANEHELRRSIYHGKAIDLLKKCTNLSIFKEITRNKTGFQRGKDEEMVLKFFALYIWLHIQKMDFDSCNDLLNQTLQYIHENIEIGAKLFEAFQEGMEKTVQVIGYHAFNIENRIPYTYFSSVLLETFCNIANLEGIEETRFYSFYNELSRNKKFIKAVHSNSTKNLLYRYKLVEQFKNSLKC